MSVPPYFKKQPQLVLQVGLNMAIPIPDLKVDDDGVTCTLSFSRTPFWCSLPWTAVYALVGEDGRGMIWPTEVPREVAAQMERNGQAGQSGQAGQAGQAAQAAQAGQAAQGKTGTAQAGERAERPAAKSGPGAAAVRDKSRRDPKKRKSPGLAAADGGGPRAVPGTGDGQVTHTSAPTVLGSAPGAGGAGAGSRPRSPMSSPTQGITPPGTRTSAPGRPARKGKRELPPYLRVVK